MEGARPVVEMTQVINIRIIGKGGCEYDISMGRVSLALGLRLGEARVGGYM